MSGKTGIPTRFCGHLPKPQDDCGEGDDGTVVSCGFFVSDCDVPKLLELGKAALNEMSLGIEVLVEGAFPCSGRVVGNDRHSALIGGRLAQEVGIVGGIGHDDLGRQAVDQAIGLWVVASLTSRQDEAHWGSQTSHRHMDFGIQAATRASNGQITLQTAFAVPMA